MKLNMKLSILAVALLAGCASNDYNGITTGSRFYDARMASEAGLSQEQTTKCEEEGRAEYDRHVASTAFGNVDGTAAGQTYERCVKRMAPKKAA